jgi:hypothetical protein
MKPIKIFFYAISYLLPASLLFLILSLAYSSFQTISAQNTLLKLKEIQNNTRSQKTLYEEWQKIEETYKTFQTKFLLKSDKLNNFRQEVQLMARRNGFGAVNMNNKINSIPFTDVLNITFTIEAAGNYRSIKRFIFDIENKKEMILFKKIQLKKRRNTQMVDARIIMEVYFVY